VQDSDAVGDAYSGGVKNTTSHVVDTLYPRKRSAASNEDAGDSLLILAQ
jgi:hypothetical protein